MKHIKPVMTIDRKNIIENSTHNGHDPLVKIIFKSDIFAFASLLDALGKTLINIIAIIAPGIERSHSLSIPYTDANRVIISGAPANPILPDIRNIDITNVDFLSLISATPAAPLGWKAATPEEPIMSIIIRIIKFGAEQILPRNIAEHKTPAMMNSFLLNLSPKNPNTGCRIEPNTANTVGNKDT